MLKTKTVAVQYHDPNYANSQVDPLGLYPRR